MSRTIVRLFDRPADALSATEELERVGIAHSDISLIANNQEGWYDEKDGIRHDRLKRQTHDHDHDGKDDRAEGAGKGAALGGIVGGGAGLLAGLGMLAIPGLGPIVAAGWVAATATGAAAGVLAGGATGGILGALTKEGVPEADAHVYAEGVRRGGSLVSVRVADDRAKEVEAILTRFNSTDAMSRSTAYRDTGWSKFDPAAPAFTEADIARERERYPSKPTM